MKKIIVHLQRRSYPIFIGEKLENLGSYLKSRSFTKKIFVITNPKIKDLYYSNLYKGLKKSGFEVSLAAISDGEQYKNLDTIKKLYLSALKSKLDRKSNIIALGGGVIGDISGFVAATYLRGVNFIQVPTTLLAMVDSSVGGKTGVDLEQGKNLIGAFYQPNLVWIDIRTLNTLSEKELKNGMAEVIKYGIISDKKFFDYLEQALNQDKIDNKNYEKIIHRCCQLKANVVEKDEQEKKGVREILNFGHTFGHAIETITNYKNYSHGEAVAIGMNIAGHLAEKLGLLKTTDRQRITNILKLYELPTVPDTKLSIDQMIDVMYTDKKVRDGKIRFVLPAKIGNVIIYTNVSSALLKQIINSLITKN